MRGGGGAFRPGGVENTLGLGLFDVPVPYGSKRAESCERSKKLNTLVAGAGLGDSS